MKIQDLLLFVIQPNLGSPWPESEGKEEEFRPSWYPGKAWRVEYTFSWPALPLESIPLGSEVRGIWKYEVLKEGSDDAGDYYLLKVSPEKRVDETFHYEVKIGVEDLVAREVKRVQGGEAKILTLNRIPKISERALFSEDGETLLKEFLLEIKE
jgi:hypothetical protein